MKQKSEIQAVVLKSACVKWAKLSVPAKYMYGRARLFRARTGGGDDVTKYAVTDLVYAPMRQCDVLMSSRAKSKIAYEAEGPDARIPEQRPK